MVVNTRASGVQGPPVSYRGSRVPGRRCPAVASRYMPRRAARGAAWPRTRSGVISALVPARRRACRARPATSSAVSAAARRRRRGARRPGAPGRRRVPERRAAGGAASAGAASSSTSSSCFASSIAFLKSTSRRAACAAARPRPRTPSGRRGRRSRTSARRRLGQDRVVDLLERRVGRRLVDDARGLDQRRFVTRYSSFR